MVPTPAFLVRLLFLAVAWPALAFAQNVSVSVNAAQGIRTVDERVFGANSVVWDSQASTDQTIGMLQSAGLRTVRIPGGSISDEYHWRINKSLANTWTWATSMNGFTKIITGLNTQTFATVNYGTGTPEEAAAWVAYANASTGSAVAIGTDSKGYNWENSGTWAALRAASPIGTDDGMNFLRIGRAGTVGIKYWEIGNECYGTWETDEQAVKNDPTTYANRAAIYMEKMRAVDPTIKIGVVVVRTDENNSYKNWTPVMLARLKVLNAIPDFIIYHRYPQAPAKDQPNNPESDAGLLQQAAGNTSGWAYTATDLRNQLTTHLGASGAGVEVVVTENNSVYSNPGKQSTSLVNGLYLADSIANVMKTEINGFMWWAIRNGPPPTSTTNQSASLYGWRMYGDYGMISTPFSEGATTYASSYYDPHPTYYAMKLLSRFARGGDTVVQATSGNPLLAVFAVKRNDGSVSLLVLNKDPNNTLTASVALTGFTPAATATVYSYGKPQDDAAKPGGSGLTDLATTALNIAGANFTASFGPYSSTVLTLSPAATGVAPLITTQPAGQVVTQGAPATFTATASGTPVPTFQWKKDGLNIAGATSATYAIPTVTLNDAGSYTVVATNTAGSVTSDAAMLTVFLAGTDFNGDGKSDLLWQNQLNGDRYVWMMNGTSLASSSYISSLPAEWSIAATGDFNADGETDLVWQNTVTGDRYIYLMNGVSLLAGANLGNVSPVWSIVAAADFNGDGQTDLVWQNTANGDRYVYFMNGTSFLYGASLGNVPLAWTIAGAADFNADGHPDLLWQNTATGEEYVWLMNGITYVSGVSLGTDYYLQLAGTGDYNDDGKPDILLTNMVTGERFVRLMDGTSVINTVSLGTLGLEWILNRPGQRRVPADFNVDGRSDLVWQNFTTGERYIYLMNGTSLTSGESLDLGVSSAWTVVTTADFNADGKPDVVGENLTTGERVIWLMNGNTVSSTVSLGIMPQNWTIAAAADMNQDGKPDLVWQDTNTGSRYLWLMNGTTFSSGQSLTLPASAQWRIAATADFDGDGKADLVGENMTTGERAVWIMNNGVVTSTLSLGTVPGPWVIANTIDLDADGHPDVIWQNTTTGERYIYLMNGTTFVSAVFLTTIPTNWSICR